MMPAQGPVSLIIPAYDEAQRIDQTLTRVMAYAQNDTRVHEVIVVDDGSRDATARIVRECCDRATGRGAALRLIEHGQNQGKGAAVRTGMLAAGGEVAVFTDADLSSPIDALPALVDPILAGEADIVVASRALDRSLIDRRQSRFRETAGKLFNLIVRMLTALEIQDTQCGFKAFRREAILPVFRMQRIGKFAFDVEVLYLAQRRGLTIREVPLPWSHVSETKVRLFRDAWRMFLDVLRIRLNDLRGRYRDAGGDAAAQSADP